MKNRGFFLEQFDRDHVWHPFQLPITHSTLIKKAKGVYLIDQHNKKYIDAVSSWWVNLHGHGNLKLNNALQRQFRKADHIIFSGFTHEPAIRLSAEILKRSGNHHESVFFSDDGSTSVEVAMKMGFQFLRQKGYQKINLFAFENAYHGDTFGAMSLAGPSIFNQSFTDLLFETTSLPLPDKSNLKEIKALINEKTDKTTASIFIYEPLIQGAGGMNMYKAEDLAELLLHFKKTETLLIADEVMTGFYRTGTFTATEQINKLSKGINPDFICLSKGITGGVLPLGATLITKEIVQWFSEKPSQDRFYHGHSYTANALACAVGVESLRLLNKSAMENIQRIHNKHLTFTDIAKKTTGISNANCCGTILRLEFGDGKTTGYNHGLRDQIYSYFLQEGILLRPLGNVVYILPPYIITDKQLDHIYKHILTFAHRLSSVGK